MSEPKAQLVDPQENMNLPGMNATGVITASSFSGDGGVVTGLTGNPNLNVGVVTATSFVGDGTGHAAGLTGTPNLNLGLTTATSFIGDATGKAAGLTGTPNLNVGLVTATSFVGDVTGDITGNITGNVTGNITGNVTGNVTGIAGSVIQGNNIHVGVVTATSLYGDGSNLTGIAATNFNTQTVTINSGITTVDLSAGNMITIDQETSTTVSFANTSEAMDLTLIRTGGGGNYNISYSTGGVTFDGTDDALTIAADSDFDFGTGAYTIEFWVKTSTSNAGWTFFNSDSTGNWYGMRMAIASGVVEFNEQVNDQDDVVEGTTNVTDNAWHHVAICRGASGDKTKLYIDGKLDATGSANRNFDNDNPVHIGKRNTGYSGNEFNGILSNYRVNKGNAVYTGPFVPPSSALTNISGTVFLALQSTTDDTAYTVSPGTITASSSPTAGAQTIARSGTYPTQGSITWPSSIKWNNGTAPSWDTTNTTSSEWNQIQLITRDSGVTWYGWENAEVEYSVKYHLYAWGNDEQGVQGQNTNYVHLSSPTQIPGVWSHINVQRDQKRNVMATKPDGSLWTWGNGQYGMSGMNNTTSRSSPIQIGTDTNWSLYNLGGSGSGINVTKTDGTLWAWGGNWNGNLGLNHDDNRSSPIQVGTDTTWATAQYSLLTTSDTQTSAAIKTNGTLWTWGNNNEGILGLNAPAPTKQSSPTQVGTNTTWSKVFGGKEWISAIKTDGTLWTWGKNSVGQLGLNNKTSRSSPTQIGTDTTWQNLNSGGYGLNFATKTDGTGWLWGYGEYGNFGNNTGTYRRSSPTQLPGSWSQGTVALFPFTMATKTDGTLWAWGRNNDQGGGNLGQNNRTTYSSPRQIPGTTWRYCWGAFAASFALKDAE